MFVKCCQKFARDIFIWNFFFKKKLTSASLKRPQKYPHSCHPGSLFFGTEALVTVWLFNSSHMAGVQSFPWLMRPAHSMPVYSETADPVEKTPQPAVVPISPSSHGGPASLQEEIHRATVRSLVRLAVMNRALVPWGLGGLFCRKLNFLVS